MQASTVPGDNGDDKEETIAQQTPLPSPSPQGRLPPRTQGLHAADVFAESSSEAGETTQLLSSVEQGAQVDVENVVFADEPQAALRPAALEQPEPAQHVLVADQDEDEEEVMDPENFLAAFEGARSKTLEGSESASVGTTSDDGAIGRSSDSDSDFEVPAQGLVVKTNFVSASEGNKQTGITHHHTELRFDDIRGFHRQVISYDVDSQDELLPDALLHQAIHKCWTIFAGGEDVSAVPAAYIPHAFELLGLSMPIPYMFKLLEMYDEVSSSIFRNQLSVHVGHPDAAVMIYLCRMTMDAWILKSSRLYAHVTLDLNTHP
eukprot:SAG31_NODE_1083_length_10012_cov_5.562796_3_plen_319_part_00